MTKHKAKTKEPSNGLANLVGLLRGEIENLTYKNYKSGLAHLVNSVEKRAYQNPYEVAFSGFELGASLANLQPQQIRDGFLHFAKTLMIHSIENKENK